MRIILEGKNTGDYEDKTGDELWRPEKGIDYWEKASTEETHKFLNHVFNLHSRLNYNVEMLPTVEN
ncbi:MAG: hypothetical protein J6A79_03570 [Clostridia bacterium]|nr:hypothetical protein [Clostridia bacterium]